MTLERKLQHLKTWNPDKRLEVFEAYHNKCSYKGRDGSSATQRGEDLDVFIEKDFARFVRYTTMWKYNQMLKDYNVESLHHIAQENKLKRYQHGCTHPAPHKIHSFP